MAFVKFHQPCPVCSSSDACSINEDGSAYCFSCNTRIANYDKGDNIEDIKVHRTNSVNEIEGSFIALNDRGISLATAKKYNVKCITNKEGKVIRHFYPYCVAAEVLRTKLEKMVNILLGEETHRVLACSVNLHLETLESLLHLSKVNVMRWLPTKC